jgi:hypothetical protein
VHLLGHTLDSGVVSLDGAVKISGDINRLIAGVIQRLREF